jgi:hypothetical protein
MALHEELKRYLDDGQFSLSADYPRAYELIKKAAERLEELETGNTSTNTGMLATPKLPTLEECNREVQSRIWAGGFASTSVNITECVYIFISRQLQHT